MRFDRGMKVEVLTKKKVPSGIWRCAEIVRDNRDSYTVRYYRRAGVLGEAVEKVPVEAVRPCPPRGTGPMIWAVGDIVEVFDNGYWKAAEIEEVMEKDYYYIHILGSIDEFRVKESNIRARQELRDNKWVLIEKDSGICKDMICRKLKKDHVQPVLEVLQSAVSKTLKRLTPDSSAAHEASLEVKKRRAIGKFENVPGDSYSFIGKVDILAYPGENQVEDTVQFLTKKKIMHNNANHKSQGDVECRTLESEDCISIVSSAASCSNIHVIPDRLLSHSSASCSQDSDSLCSDADSFECFGNEGGMVAHQSTEEYAFRVHEMELYTYRKILEVLYASGPLSWEQEVILTNLRIKLYVSNDEHLLELRRLKSISGLRVSCQH